ncbi:hypothetical protein SOCE26_013290 [Sorangium cellulosum]|uniref:Uncharacterized protein n=1 Tax=Sorangium cellulosum TaxID=56 RepID=A0A2L0EKX5_SORCE|nr:hypothetical protein [Sorangium cellulosum]AUX39934.1 hypothetical protein SOCE26_013290 [Sorangium cellulosum]
MKHSLDELLDIVYRYYPRGVGITGDVDEELIRQTEEHARLVAARIRASKDERWQSMLRRIDDRFPRMLMNRSLHLITGGCDGCYSFTVDLLKSTGEPLWFQISFLAPYYIVHKSCTIEIVKQVSDLFVVVFRGLRFIVYRSPFDPGFVSRPDDSLRFVNVSKRYVTFDLLPEEQLYVEWISRDIEATFGCERMPPEIGTVLVPDVTAGVRLPGEVRLYDCLFSDEHSWVKPSPSEVSAGGVDVEVSKLTDSLVAVLTVLAALYQIAWALMPEVQSGSSYWVMTTDGVLRKEEVLRVLAKIRVLMDPPKTPRGIASKRELEAAARELETLVASWDGEGDPPAAMVAWASRFLDSWLVNADPGASS